MKKLLFIFIAAGVLVASCAPTPASQTPEPISQDALQATAAVLSQLTLQALVSPTIAPSNTPVVSAPSNTPTVTVTAGTPTETQNPALVSLTSTLLTGTPVSATGTPQVTTTAPAGSATATRTVTATTATSQTATNTSVVSAVIVNGTLPFTHTPNPAFSATPTETPHFQTYGTMPPNLPWGRVFVVNKANADAYISLHVTTDGGYTTIVESPVSGSVKLLSPLGRYTFVAWVGGRKFTGSFSLRKDDVLITLFKNKVEVGN